MTSSEEDSMRELEMVIAKSEQSANEKLSMHSSGINLIDSGRKSARPSLFSKRSKNVIDIQHNKVDNFLDENPLPAITKSHAEIESGFKHLQDDKIFSFGTKGSPTPIFSKKIEPNRVRRDIEPLRIDISPKRLESSESISDESLISEQNCATDKPGAGHDDGHNDSESSGIDNGMMNQRPKTQQSPVMRNNPSSSPESKKSNRLEVSNNGVLSQGDEGSSGKANSHSNEEINLRRRKKRLTNTEVSSPLKVGARRANKRISWKQVEHALSMEQMKEKTKTMKSDPIQEDDDEEIVEGDLNELGPVARNPGLEKLNQHLNDSLNMGNMSRRSVLKLKSALKVKTAKPDQAELRKRLMNLHASDPDARSPGLNGEVGSDGDLLKSKVRNSRIQKRIDQRRMERILKLGPMGLELEELKVGIERKYEEMLNILKQRLDRLKNYFSMILDNIKKDFQRDILIEKQQNLKNLKEMEVILTSAMEDDDEEDEELNDGFVSDSKIKLLALQDFFNFVKEFKEESYSLIISQMKPMNILGLKKELNSFVSKNLRSLFESPKSFPTQLYTFFLDNQELYEEDEEKIFGSAISLTSLFPEEVKFKNTLNVLEPELQSSRNRTPLIKILSKDYLVVTARNDFKVFKFGWRDKLEESKKPKSRFFKPKPVENTGAKVFDYKLIFSSLEENIERETKEIEERREKELNSPTKRKPAYHYLGFSSSLIKPEELRKIKEKIKPGFHCVCHFICGKTKRELLLFGGNYNRLFKYEIIKEKTGEIEEIKYIGELNFKELDPDQPRQKINAIYQYKQKTHVVCAMSYGYAAVLDIDLSGMKDKLNNISRVHRGNISSATFVQDFEYFVTCSGSFSRNHDNSIVISRCSLAEDLFFKKVYSISNVHGKHKGVMSVKSTNNIGDSLLLSSGNDDDCRILIHDLTSRTVVKQIKRQNFGFYFMNIVVFDKDEDSEFVESYNKPEQESPPKKFSEENMINNQIARLTNKSKSDVDDNIFKTEGIVILAAGITNICLFVYDYIDDSLEIEEELDVLGDLGSYLNIMELVKMPDDENGYYLFMGTTEGRICIYQLNFEINYDRQILNGITNGFGNIMNLGGESDLDGGSESVIANAGESNVSGDGDNSGSGSSQQSQGSGSAPQQIDLKESRLSEDVRIENELNKSPPY